MDFRCGVSSGVCGSVLLLHRSIGQAPYPLWLQRSFNTSGSMSGLDEILNGTNSRRSGWCWLKQWESRRKRQALEVPALPQRMCTSQFTHTPVNRHRLIDRLVSLHFLSSRYTFKCDTWSLGVVFFRMLLGYLPFQDEVAVHPLLAQNFEAKIQRHILTGKVIIRNKETRLTQPRRKWWSLDRDFG